MKKSVRFTLVSVLLLAAYVLNACTGIAPQAQSQSSVPSKGSKVQAEVVAFTGTVDAINGNQWTINGQVVTIDPQTVDPNIKVGDVVKVEGTVNADGSVSATSVETNGPDDSSVAAQPSATEDPASTSTPDPVSTSSPDVSSSPDASATPAPVSTDDSNPNEVTGTVQAITADSITIDGVTYQIGSSSEIKGTLAVGDTVKIEFTVNPDGTLTIKEAKASTDISNNGQSGSDDSLNDNSNSGSDDGSNHDSNDDNGGSSGGDDSGGSGN